MRSDLLLNAWCTVVLVALVPVILVAAEYGLWLFPLIGIPLVAIQLGSRQAVINEHQARPDRVTGLSEPRAPGARARARAPPRGRHEAAGRRADRRACRASRSSTRRSGIAAATSVLRRRAAGWPRSPARRRRGAARRRRVLAGSSAGRRRRRTASPWPSRRSTALRAPVMIRGVALDLEAHARDRLPSRARRHLRRAAAPRRRRARAGQGLPPGGRSSTPSDVRRARRRAADARLRPAAARSPPASSSSPSSPRSSSRPARCGRSKRWCAGPIPSVAPRLARGIHRARRAHRPHPAR